LKKPDSAHFGGSLRRGRGADCRSEQRQLEWRATTTTLAGDDNHAFADDNYVLDEKFGAVDDNYVCRLEHTGSAM
jgi:hypothetical protein